MSQNRTYSIDRFEEEEMHEVQKIVHQNIQGTKEPGMNSVKTLIRLFERSATQFPENPAFWEKNTSQYQFLSYQQLKDRIYHLSGGLISKGLLRGDRVALLSQARSDWVAAELAVLYAGAVSVPLSVRLDPSEIVFRLEHSKTKALIVSADQYAKVRDVVAGMEFLELVVLFDDQESYDPKELFIEEVVTLGKEYLSKNTKRFQSVYNSVKEDDCALISYTSGTTADPKGIMLSHKNLVTNCEQSLGMFSVDPEFRTLLILPLDHSFAHTTGMYVFLGSGASLAAVQMGKTPAATLKNVTTNIREIRPDALLSVPTLAKNLRKNIERKISERGSVARTLFLYGLKVAYAYNKNGGDKGKGIRWLLKPVYHLFDRLLFAKIRTNFGGRLKYFVGGGALLDTDLQKFFLAIGLPMYQGYGLSEAAPVISSNTEENHRIGSSGKIVRDLDVKICDEKGNPVETGSQGEILVKGDNVMLGYYKNEEATRQVLREGWLYTGDLGYFDRDGYLYVLGRTKSLLIGDDGEKYSPEGIEEHIEEHADLVRQIMIYNNQQPYTTALLFPDTEALSKRFKRSRTNGWSEDVLTEMIRTIDAELDYHRQHQSDHGFPPRWFPSSFIVLPDGFTMENHMLNSTMKMVRRKIAEHYKEEIDFLYTRTGKKPVNDRNIETLKNLLS
jgi:long-chain acyl-CoA synthetase